LPHTHFLFCIFNAHQFLHLAAKGDLLFMAEQGDTADIT
jgi:hypothetical protein